MAYKKLLSILLPGLFLLALAALLLLGTFHVVVSGSMEPTIHTGSLVWNRPIQGEIVPGMMVTYRYQDILITHRVVSVDGERITTQGDNNEEPDPWDVPASSITGSPELVIPYAGYLVAFVQRPLGWALLVIFPAGWIVVDEVRKIIHSLRSQPKVMEE